MAAAGAVESATDLTQMLLDHLASGLVQSSGTTLAGKVGGVDETSLNIVGEPQSSKNLIPAPSLAQEALEIASAIREDGFAARRRILERAARLAPVTDPSLPDVNATMAAGLIAAGEVAAAENLFALGPATQIALEPLAAAVRLQAEAHGVGALPPVLRMLLHGGADRAEVLLDLIEVPTPLLNVEDAAAAQVCIKAVRTGTSQPLVNAASASTDMLAKEIIETLAIEMIAGQNKHPINNGILGSLLGGAPQASSVENRTAQVSQAVASVADSAPELDLD